MSSSLEEIYAAIRALPVPKQLRLVERVVHDVAEAEAKSTALAEKNLLVAEPDAPSRQRFHVADLAPL